MQGAKKHFKIDIMMHFIVYYDRISSNGVKRTYSREFTKAYDAYEYMRKKTSDERNERVRGYSHHDVDGVTYVAKINL